MYGKLYICATPIGNLSDISKRCIDTLKEVDLIAAEDTRKTVKLLNHFGIDTKMTSYYEHNKRKKSTFLLDKLKEGKNIAIVSDAGTPAISDPGEDIVKECIQNGIEVTIVPGACAAVAALAISGLSTGRFCFEGFLSMRKTTRNKHLEELKNERRTIIFYEAPHKLKNTLLDIKNVLGDRNIVLARELTKIHEEVIRTTVFKAIEYYSDKEPKGEFVLLIEGAQLNEEQNEWEDLTISEHVKSLVKDGISEADAIKTVAKMRGLRKNEVYSEVKIK